MEVEPEDSNNQKDQRNKWAELGKDHPEHMGAGNK